MLAQQTLITYLQNRLVGLGIGLGGNPLLLTNICNDGEKHCCRKKGQMKTVQNFLLNIQMLHSTLQNKHPLFYSLFILTEKLATDYTDYQI